MPVKENSNGSVQPRLKLPKPMERYTSETIELSFFTKRIIEITHLIIGRRESKIFLSILLWEQIKDFLIKKDNFFDHRNIRYLTTTDIDYSPLFTEDVKAILKGFDFIDPVVPFQYIPEEIIEIYDIEGETTLESAIEDPGNILTLRIKPQYVKIIIGVSNYLRSPLEEPWKFIEDLFKIPRHFEENFIQSSPFNEENIPGKIQLDGLNLFFNFFEYLSVKFSGIKEHFLKIAAALFWVTKITPTYSLEVFELLSEVFGEHKLETRSTQLFEAGRDNDLLFCERKGKNKNRSIIYFSLNEGAEWMIAGLFPDAKLITLQQAISISFLRYAQKFLIQPWEIPPIEFNYLLDIWLRHFLYTNNLDIVVYQKAKEHVRLPNED
ncbi:MAG: hypothetical protein ACFFD1_02220 [Candidatus Thorarchaeota archaeon]